MLQLNKGGEKMITVLLATYNGSEHIRAQIDSLLSQTYTDFKIVIRDDGSSDQTPVIIAELAEKYPEKISVITGEPTRSACGNFSKLFEAVDDDYIMFCDQDDVWLPEKIEKTLAAMKAAEAKNPGSPVLVHSDLRVVDGALNTICESFFEFQQVPQHKVTLSRLLVQNYVTGCTMMINRPLKTLCGAVPPECAMHDWWIALVCALFGEIVCIKEPLMLYRQHGGNQVGAKAAKGIGFVKRKLQTLDRVRDNYTATYVQAKILLERYGEQLSNKDKDILEAYCSMTQKNKLQKIKLLRKYDFRKSTTIRVIGQYFLM